MTAPATARSAQQARRKRPAPSGLQAAAGAALAGAGALLTAGSTALLVVEPDLPLVDPRTMQIASGLTQVDSVPGDWRVLAVLAAAGLLACGGLGRPRATAGGAAAAAAQVAAALLTLLACTAATLLTTMWTHGPDDPCRYASCWPAGPQALAVAMPAVLTAMSLTATAAFRNRLPWPLRAVLPVAAWLSSLAMLRLTWEPWLLPVLLSPP